MKQKKNIKPILFIVAILSLSLAYTIYLSYHNISNEDYFDCSKMSPYDEPLDLRTVRCDFKDFVLDIKKVDTGYKTYTDEEYLKIIQKEDKK